MVPPITFHGRQLFRLFRSSLFFFRSITFHLPNQRYFNFLSNRSLNQFKKGGSRSRNYRRCQEEISGSFACTQEWLHRGLDLGEAYIRKSTWLVSNCIWWWLMMSWLEEDTIVSIAMVAMIGSCGMCLHGARSCDIGLEIKAAILGTVSLNFKL